MERTVTGVTRQEYEHVWAKVNRDTGEVIRIGRQHPHACYTVEYSTPRKKNNTFECRAADEAEAIALAHENFARIDAGIHLRDVNKKGANQ
jgi:hypothetical protein